MINTGVLLALNHESNILWTRYRSRVYWEEFVRCQVRANETYSEAKHQFSNRIRDVPMNVQSPHKRWSTLVCSVRLEFVIASACCWWWWCWTGVRVGW